MEITGCTSQNCKETLPYVAGGVLVITLLVIGILAFLKAAPFASFAYTNAVSATCFGLAGLIILYGIVFFEISRCSPPLHAQEPIEREKISFSKSKKAVIERRAFKSLSVKYPLSKGLELYSNDMNYFIKTANVVLGGSVTDRVSQANAFESYTCEDFYKNGGEEFQDSIAYGKLRDGWFLAARYIFQSENETFEQGTIALIAKCNVGYAHWHTDCLKGDYLNSKYDQTDPEGFISGLDNPSLDDVLEILHEFIQGNSHRVEFLDGDRSEAEFILAPPISSVL